MEDVITYALIQKAAIIVSVMMATYLMPPQRNALVSQK